LYNTVAVPPTTAAPAPILRAVAAPDDLLSAVLEELDELEALAGVAVARVVALDVLKELGVVLAA